MDHDRTLFAEPRAPLSEMVAAAGLEIRGTQIAADQAVWMAAAYSRAYFELLTALPTRPRRRPQQEIRWCTEPVPALEGLTPQEAAADPTRREQVIRLIDSYERAGEVTVEGAMTMRPDRLRSLLGIAR